MKKIGIIKVGKLIAILSFIVGTLFLIIFYFSNSTELAFGAYFFIIIAAIINAIIIGLLIKKSFLKKENRKKYLKTVFVMLLNIPVVIIYFYFVLILINTMRITLVNKTGHDIKKIRVEGGQSKDIERLKNGDKKTIWVGITSDSSLILKYLTENSEKEEILFSYVTSSMGQKITYEIGIDNKPIDFRF